MQYRCHKIAGFQQNISVNDSYVANFTTTVATRLLLALSFIVTAESRSAPNRKYKRWNKF